MKIGSNYFTPVRNQSPNFGIKKADNVELDAGSRYQLKQDLLSCYNNLSPQKKGDYFFGELADFDEKKADGFIDEFETKLGKVTIEETPGKIIIDKGDELGIPSSIAIEKGYNIDFLSNSMLDKLNKVPTISYETPTGYVWTKSGVAAKKIVNTLIPNQQPKLRESEVTPKLRACDILPNRKLGHEDEPQVGKVINKLADLESYNSEENNFYNLALKLQYPEISTQA